MTTERDRDAATAFLVATGMTQKRETIDALAEWIATVRAEECERIIDWAEGYLDVGGPEGMRREAFEKGAALLRAGDHQSDLTDVAHAGECALCRAPFVRTEGGAVPSCGCADKAKTADP